MDEKPSVHPTRQLSDRKSKPSMEALIDQHKRFVWSPPRHHRIIDDFHPPIHSPMKVDTSEATCTDVISKPLRIRIQVPKLDLPAAVEVYSPTSQRHQNIEIDDHKFVSSIISPVKLSSNGVADTRVQVLSIDTEEDEEDDMPLADLCKFDPSIHESPISDSVRLLSDSVKQPFDSMKLLLDLTDVNPEPAELSIGPLELSAEPVEITSPPPPLVKIEMCHLKSCQNAANLTDTRWDGQFCSSDCVIEACRQSFKAHILHHRTSLFTNHHKFVS